MKHNKLSGESGLFIFDGIRFSTE